MLHKTQNFSPFDPKWWYNVRKMSKDNLPYVLSVLFRVFVVFSVAWNWHPRLINRIYFWKNAEYYTQRGVFLSSGWFVTKVSFMSRFMWVTEARHKASFLALQDSQKHFWWRPDLDAGCVRFISLFRSSWVLPTEHHLFFEISTRLLPDGSPLTLGAVLMSTVMFVHMIVLLIAGIHTRCGRLC